MLLGALIDSGLALHELVETLQKLPLEGYSITSRQEQRGHIRGTHVTVDIDSEKGAGYSIQDFIEIIEASSLQVSIKSKAKEILNRIELAESRVHGEGHPLKELGDIDTIIDVVGVVSGFEALGIDQLYCSPLPSGWGVTSSREGPLTVPAPATMELLVMAKALIAPPKGPYSQAGELVTPTGAAIITTLASFDPPPMIIETVGHGIGTKDMPTIPNVLSLWIGSAKTAPSMTNLSLLETNVDDSTPEIMGYLQESLLTHGALDVWFTPIQMKKNRPAVALSVLCYPDMETILTKIILAESSTLGVRINSLRRFESEREVITVETELGTARVKLKKTDAKVTGISPEFEDCKEISIRTGIPLQEVFRIIENETRKSLEM